MSRRLPLRASDLRGAARLAADATVGLADLVEAMHAGIARMPGLPASGAEGRTVGLTGLVYRTVRGVTRVVGGSVDALLGAITPQLSNDDTGVDRAALVAALNGVLGDHLAATNNPLATPMAFRRGGRALPSGAAALATALPQATGRLVVLMHGLCMSDLQWCREGHDHGASLEADLGFTAAYLHYDSGLHISTNGRLFSEQLERLLADWPRPVERLVLLGHSMGGLVARSAFHHARQAGHRWPDRLDDLVFLGSPHHGAPLERAGHWFERLLGAMPYAAPLARLGRVRSAGITDLRHAWLRDEDWQGRDRFAAASARRPAWPVPMPLPDDVRCFAVAATLGRRDGDAKDRLLGDGLVPVDSALGRHRDPARTLAFPDDRQWTAFERDHLQLLSDPEVYARVRDWLR